MLPWNYRIIRKTSHQNYEYFEIHEVHYSADGVTIENWTVSPIAPYGETLDELRGSMKLMSQAFERPVLDLKVVDGKETLVEVDKEKTLRLTKKAADAVFDLIDNPPKLSRRLKQSMQMREKLKLSKAISKKEK